MSGRCGERRTKPFVRATRLPVGRVRTDARGRLPGGRLGRFAALGAMVPLSMVLMLGAGCAAGDQSGDGPVRDAVTGTATCALTTLPSGTTEDGTEVVKERFTCTDVTSDPRVSGEEVLEIETLLYDDHSAPWSVTSATITTEDGVWRGTGDGVLRFDGDGPYNYGETTYRGEGPYEGLTYHCLVAGSNGELVLAGWIESTE